MSWWRFKRRQSAAERRAKAGRAATQLAKKGRRLSPVRIAGRTIATTFWGKAWCDNLESYSDYENRLPRGRTYVRNGSVLDLQIEAGKIKALVAGSDLYDVNIDITPQATAGWKMLKERCAGQIGSLVELLQGKLSEGVMDLVTAREGGLFPKPKEIKIRCSCPDWAGLCKHAAAVLYGVGARLDHEPELLFKLRKVDHLELISEAYSSAAFAESSSKGKKILAPNELSDVFGIEFAESGSESAPEAPAVPETAPQKSRRRQPKATPPNLTSAANAKAMPDTAPKKRASRRGRKAVPAAVPGKAALTARKGRKQTKAKVVKRHRSPRPK
jgi:uncharacterized Zn finger protein